MGLRFHDAFHRSHIKGKRYDVRFQLNRTSLRLQHRGLEEIAKHMCKQNWLFPDQSYLSTAQHQITLVADRHLNERQQLAVRVCSA